MPSLALDRAGTQLWRQEALRLRDVDGADALREHARRRRLRRLPALALSRRRLFLARERGRSAHASAPLVVGQNVYVQGDDGTVAAFTLRVQDEEA